jgi:DNA-binding response OmpR family regulator
VKASQIPHSAHSYTAPTPLKSNPPTRILIVDDDMFTRHLSTAVLSRSGYEVDTAEDGAVAWQALNAANYDLVITDNNMPELTGVDLLRKLRAARMALPVIMATGTLPTLEFAQSPWLMPDATLLKPFSSGELLGKVKDVLQMNDSNARRPDPSLPLAAECPKPDQIAAPALKRDVPGDLPPAAAESQGGHSSPRVSRAGQHAFEFPRHAPEENGV